MNFNNLTCRCGHKDDWWLIQAYTGEWVLELDCNNCGAVYKLYENKNERCTIAQMVYELSVKDRQENHLI